jgi:hypothetical protein
VPDSRLPRVGLAPTVRHEVGTVSAHMRDNSVDSVTPGGRPAPLGARGGVHDVSDILGGAFLRLAWLSACLLGVLRQG